MPIQFGTLTPAQQNRYESLGLPKGTTITRYTTDILPARTNIQMYDFIQWHRQEGLPEKLEKASSPKALEQVIVSALDKRMPQMAEPKRLPIEHGGSTAVDIWFHLKNKTDWAVSDTVFDRLLELMKVVKTKAEALAQTTTHL